LSSLSKIERVLQTYTLEEILEWNELTEADILEYCVDVGLITLPNPKPIDYDQA
jgi:hypothetical protein